MQKFITHLKSITPLTEQQEADVKSELERLMEVSDFYGIDYDNPNPPETEPTPEEQREADLYWESQSKRQVIRSKQGIFSSITNSLFKL